MKTFDKVAKNLEDAKQYAAQVMSEGGHIEVKACDCACGETEAVWVYDEKGQREMIIAVCGACYDDASFIDRV